MYTRAEQYAKKKNHIAIILTDTANAMSHGSSRNGFAGHFHRKNIKMMMLFLLGFVPNKHCLALMCTFTGTYTVTFEWLIICIVILTQMPLF